MGRRTAKLASDGLPQGSSLGHSGTEMESEPSSHNTQVVGDDWEYEALKNPTLMIRRTLRSGQRVHFHGNVVVVGDVNPGAEITAAGDIVVMGWLRGVAHAGAYGNVRSMVSAFRLNPTQLRIAHLIARAPDDVDEQLPEVPEFAEVREGHLVIDQWQTSQLGPRS
ncbi:MAG: septum site-determining protein MinC [Firmicutes bacterium]|jgi:septum site-determining protein MinC|nr:septum site-determining protein MinC [Bacillota bacterium]MCL5064653.1 septum site-determining protein MinC [Bacillota bacterium]